MSHGTTLDPVQARREGDDDSSDSLALVVAWAAGDAARVGEILLVPPGKSFVFGRGEPRDDDPEPRLQLVRQRPAIATTRGSDKSSDMQPTPPLSTPFISRVQLRLTGGAAGIEIENLGRRALLVGDRKVERATIAADQMFELHDQMVFLCVRRSSRLPKLRDLTGDLGAFGEPDAQGLVGESPALWMLRDRVAFFAARDVHVLVLGESGTGKELVARAVHDRSSRRGRPLVARNAATFPSGLIDAELFGNVKNYPNVGMPERVGLVGEANGSTLFLDEIGELPGELQTHLLRVLDEHGEYQRLGEATRRTTSFRLVAATNRSPGELRSDLVARLSLTVEVPGLNERREDIPLLARHLLRRVAARDPGIRDRFFDGVQDGAFEPRIAPALVQALTGHQYKTHVRELDGLLWQALASSPGDVIELTEQVRAALDLDRPPPVAPTPAITAEVLKASLQKHEGVKERVWRDLGLANRYVLKRLLKKHGLENLAADDDEQDPG